MEKDINSINTLKAFYESIGDSIKIKHELLERIKSNAEKIFVFNCVQLENDFDKSQVRIDYYIADKEYPPITFSFDDFESLLKDNIGKYNYNSALLLYSILNSEQETGAELKNIIAFADYVNHAVMTFNEFNDSIKYLLKLGVVNETDKKLFTEISFREWYNNKYKNNRKIYLLGAIEKIQRYLNDIIKNNNLNKNIETEINETDFENAVNEYINILS